MEKKEKKKERFILLTVLEGQGWCLHRLSSGGDLMRNGVQEGSHLQQREWGPTVPSQSTPPHGLRTSH
jgi:hypothetical protein